jgi:hypothetical protein
MCNRMEITNKFQFKFVVVLVEKFDSMYVQGPAFNVTHFESRITHLLYTARNTAEHG